MSAVESLQQSAFSSNYTYMRILQQYKFDTADLHYVFEGFDDHSFYYNYLSSLCSACYTYISYGKKHSIEVYNSLNWEKYHKDRILIFIDRDYSRMLMETIPSDLNIYETSFYSIENYVADESILPRLIKEILHFHDDGKIEPLIDNYNRQLGIFINKIKPVIAWILVIRKDNLRANLNNIDLGKLFVITSSLHVHSEKIDKIEYLERVTQVTTPVITLSTLKSWYEIIDKQESYKMFLRGKFELWFLVTYFNKIGAFLLSEYGHQSRQKTFLNIGNAIEIIGPRIPQPKRLDIFLRKFRK